MIADREGQPAPTNKKKVLTFVSPTKAYMSASFTERIDEYPMWVDNTEAVVAIDGNKMTLTMHPEEEEGLTVIDNFTVTAIDATSFTANIKVTSTKNGELVYSYEGTVRYVKIDANYREPILGLWECQELTGIETYNDANARLEFFADGTYRYWRKNDGGEWEAVTNREFQNYFVDGTLLATRWKNQGEEELREWWEIASLGGGEMQWTALRQNADGTTAQQGMRWTKVN